MQQEKWYAQPNSILALLNFIVIHVYFQLYYLNRFWKQPLSKIVHQMEMSGIQHLSSHLVPNKSWSGSHTDKLSPEQFVFFLTLWHIVSWCQPRFCGDHFGCDTVGGVRREEHQITYGIVDTATSSNTIDSVGHLGGLPRGLWLPDNLIWLSNLVELFFLFLFLLWWHNNE